MWRECWGVSEERKGIHTLALNISSISQTTNGDGGDIKGVWGTTDAIGDANMGNSDNVGAIANLLNRGGRTHKTAGINALGVYDLAVGGNSTSGRGTGGSIVGDHAILAIEGGRPVCIVRNGSQGSQVEQGGLLCKKARGQRELGSGGSSASAGGGVVFGNLVGGGGELGDVNRGEVGIIDTRAQLGV